MRFSGLAPLLILFYAGLPADILVLAEKIRGTPGEDYPNYFVIPRTSFRCSEQRFNGFYADLETRCQVFHYCYEHRQESFLCPMGTIFNQPLLMCDYWYSANCSEAPSFYHVNAENGKAQNGEQYKAVSHEEPDILFDKMASLYRSGDVPETAHQKEIVVGEGGSAENDQATNQTPESFPTTDSSATLDVNSSSNDSQISHATFSQYTEQLEHAEDLVLASDGTLRLGDENPSNDGPLLSGSLFDYSFETDEQSLNSEDFSEIDEEFNDSFETTSEESDSEYELLRRSSGSFARKPRKRRPLYASIDATPDESNKDEDENQVSIIGVDSSESHYLSPKEIEMSLSNNADEKSSIGSADYVEVNEDGGLPQNDPKLYYDVMEETPFQNVDVKNSFVHPQSKNPSKYYYGTSDLVDENIEYVFDGTAPSYDTDEMSSSTELGSNEDIVSSEFDSTNSLGAEPSEYFQQFQNDVSREFAETFQSNFVGVLPGDYSHGFSNSRELAETEFNGDELYKEKLIEEAGDQEFYSSSSVSQLGNANSEIVNQIEPDSSDQRVAYETEVDHLRINSDPTSSDNHFQDYDDLTYHGDHLTSNGLGRFQIINSAPEPFEELDTKDSPNSFYISGEKNMVLKQGQLEVEDSDYSDSEGIRMPTMDQSTAWVSNQEYDNNYGGTDILTDELENRPTFTDDIIENPDFQDDMSYMQKYIQSERGYFDYSDGAQLDHEYAKSEELPFVEYVESVVPENEKEINKLSTEETYPFDQYEETKPKESHLSYADDENFETDKIEPTNLPHVEYVYSEEPEHEDDEESVNKFSNEELDDKVQYAKTQPQENYLDFSDGANFEANYVEYPHFPSVEYVNSVASERKDNFDGVPTEYYSQDDLQELSLDDIDKSSLPFINEVEHSTMSGENKLTSRGITQADVGYDETWLANKDYKGLEASLIDDIVREELPNPESSQKRIEESINSESQSIKLTGNAFGNNAELLTDQVLSEAGVVDLGNEKEQGLRPEDLMLLEFLQSEGSLDKSLLRAASHTATNWNKQVAGSQDKAAARALEQQEIIMPGKDVPSLPFSGMKLASPYSEFDPIAMQKAYMPRTGKLLPTSKLAKVGALAKKLLAAKKAKVNILKKFIGSKLPDMSFNSPKHGDTKET